MSRLLRLSLVVAACCACRASLGDVRYFGIGNDQFAADVSVARDKLAARLDFSAGDRFDVRQHISGAQILTELQTFAAPSQAGDIFIFHYAGHGSLYPETSAPAEADNDDHAIGLENPANSGIVVNGARDDQYAAIINALPASVAVMSIMDTCFAGDAIDHAASDITRGVFIGTADNTCQAPGGSIFLPLWNSALMDMNNDNLPDGDANLDGTLTFGELYSKLATITTMGHASNPVAMNFNEPAAHLNYQIWQIPEPTSLILAVFGTALAFLFLKRR